MGGFYGLGHLKQLSRMCSEYDISQNSCRASPFSFLFFFLVLRSVSFPATRHQCFQRGMKEYWLAGWWLGGCYWWFSLFFHGWLDGSDGGVRRKKGMALTVRSLKWDSGRSVKVDVWKGWGVGSA